MASAAFEKYDLDWPAGTTALEIETYMIRQGKNLFTHFRALHSLLWEDEHNKWSDLALKEFTDCMEFRKRGMVGLLGPGSSGKTYYASKFVLSHYYVYPQETTILLTTTTVQKLDLGIFGEVKKLHKQAKERWEELPGVTLDYKRCIITDRAEEGEPRDFRNGIIGIACMRGEQWVGIGCFPGEQLVDTPTGQIPIETIKEGDSVISAFGSARVKATSTRTADTLIRVTLEDSRKFDCTPEHPILTSTGWVKAIDLNSQIRVISPHETMRIMREADRQERATRVLQSGVFGQAVDTDLSYVQNRVRFERSQERTLLEILCDEIEDVRPGLCKAHCETYAYGGGSPKKSANPSGQLGESEAHGDMVEIESRRHTVSFGKEKLGSTPQERREGFQGTRQRFSAEPSRADYDGFISRSAIRADNPEPSRIEKHGTQNRLSTLRQTGLRLVGHQVGGGSGRRNAFSTSPESAGRSQGKDTLGTRVVSVKILERTSDKRYVESEGGYRVHNLEVEGHPSYSINGTVAHNSFVGIKNKWVFLVADECSLMDISYLRATSNLDKNERFFFIPIANPVNGEHSPMGQSCEPELGWGSVRDIAKTTIWETKYAKGKCINFVGPDSPNFDGNGKHYPFLIDQERIDSTLRFYGPHSEEFCAMCLGVMRPGEDSQRVLTKQLCMIHKAFEKATWKGVKRTKIYSIDAAYGGDRCVGGWIEFGEDPDGHQIVRVEKPHVIKIGMKRGAEPEDEIAEHVRDDCLREAIPVENIFYDSTGRGTLGAAFARVFGNVIPVPCEFGGRPSTRPVRLDLYIVDATNQRRLKRCDEEYQKRVSEFWFAVRWLVESEQLRELPESVANEFYQREWGYVGNNKRDVEPKEKTKQRLGRSPDEADWLATAVEGARQRGLQIAKLGADKFTEGAGKSWLADLNAKHYKLIQSMRLKTAA